MPAAVRRSAASRRQCFFSAGDKSRGIGGAPAGGFGSRLLIGRLPALPLASLSVAGFGFGPGFIEISSSTQKFLTCGRVRFAATVVNLAAMS